MEKATLNPLHRDQIHTDMGATEINSFGDIFNRHSMGYTVQTHTHTHSHTHTHIESQLSSFFSDNTFSVSHAVPSPQDLYSSVCVSASSRHAALLAALRHSPKSHDPQPCHSTVSVGGGNAGRRVNGANSDSRKVDRGLVV